MPMRNQNRTCLDCRFMGYSTGSPGYSEMTPGWDAELYCLKSYWQYDAYNDTKETLRQKLYMALTCGDFTQDTSDSETA